MAKLALVKLGSVLVLLAAAVAFPLVFSNPTYTQIAFFLLAFALAGVAWNIFSGYSGYIALGHATFFGLGAYTIAKLCQWFNTPGGWQPFLWVPVAGLVAAAFAAPLGMLALRTRRHTFVVITIAIFFIFQLMAYNVRSLTAGSAGLELPIPQGWGGFDQTLPFLPGWTGYVYNLPFYYVTLLLLVVAVAASWWVRSSKFGLELLAIRDDEDRARGLGVRTGAIKLSAFMLSAFFVGMMGALIVYFIGSVYPNTAFDATFDVTIALMAFLGGLGTLSGPVLGALLLIPAQQYFTLTGGATSTPLILFGVLFLVVLLLLPQGIVPTLSQLVKRFRRSSRSTPVAPRPAEPSPAQPVAAEQR